ncbi:EAL domain-containing protein [Bradyrhizobium septentrionale]|nr:EAL domain-containing protein [Bradyrhizobium septentrionale]UGY25973.1 EAL domain-containing protein [Bradyrhizobium septentrionale]
MTQLHYNQVVSNSSRSCNVRLSHLRDESGALVPPGSFLPAAERYGLMPLIDRWVVRRAFEIIAERKHHPRRVASYAINLSDRRQRFRRLRRRAVRAA